MGWSNLPGRATRTSQAQADTLLQGVRDELRRSEEEVQALWRTRRNYLAQLRHHLERQLSELNSAESEPLPDFTTPRTTSAARAEPSVVQEIRELPLRPAAPTPSWLDVVEEDS